MSDLHPKSPPRRRWTPARRDKDSPGAGLVKWLVWCWTRCVIERKPQCQVFCIRLVQHLHQCAFRRLHGGIQVALTALGCELLVSEPSEKVHAAEGALDHFGQFRRQSVAMPPLTSAVLNDPGFEVRLNATRREPASGNAPLEHGTMLRTLIRWQEPEATPQVALSGFGTM